MDVLSHGLWGYVAVRRRGPIQARWGGLAGAAPDLLYFLPSKTEQILEKGWQGLWIGSGRGIWRAGGPPLPPELVEAYYRYYVYTHSLVVVAAVLLIAWAAGLRRWLWLAIPYVLHIVMDLPTHERYLTRPFYPLSDWTIQGLSWSDPLIFFPNWAALVAAFLWIWRTHRSDRDPERKMEA